MGLGGIYMGREGGNKIINKKNKNKNKNKNNNNYHNLSTRKIMKSQIIHSISKNRFLNQQHITPGFFDLFD